MNFLQPTELAIHVSFNYFEISSPDLSAYSKMCENYQMMDRECMGRWVLGEAYLYLIFISEEMSPDLALRSALL